MWQLPAGDGAGKPLLWPVAGLASRDGRSFLLLAQRILGGMNVVGTTAIVVKPDQWGAGGADGADPVQDWVYSTADQQPMTCPSCANASLNFFSTITYEDLKNASNPHVLLFGHDR